MRLRDALLSLSWAAFAVAQDNQTDSPVPHRFIIELEKGANRDQFKRSLESRPGLKVLKTFDSEVFRGVAVEALKDNADTLQALQPVGKVWKSRKLTLEKPQDSAARKSFPDDAAATEYNIHSMTGVDKLHSLGIFGKGAKVGVVDTGVDYNHPALGGCFGTGCKVAGGYDFIGNSDFPLGNGTKMPDNDPLDQMGHGTHVTGIIAGKSEFFTGVAPEATIYSYKVFGTVDAVWEEDIIEGFLQAEQDGVDIISASLIGYYGFEDNAWALVGSRLVEAGFIVVCAAGNWGNLAGPFFHSNGASGEFVLSVASVDASQLGVPAFEATFSLPDGTTNTTDVAYNRFEGPWPRNLTNLPIVPLSGDVNAINEACDPLPQGTQNFTGNEIVLVRRGGCYEGQKLANLNEYNARYIFMYNTPSDEVTQISFVPWYGQIGAVIESRAGEAIIEAINAGGNVTANFDIDPTKYVGVPSSYGFKPSSFTSWGSLPDLKIKPDIAAPGGNILSTRLGGGYLIEGGTSQAAPYIAGVAALWIGKYGGRSVHGNGVAKQLAAKIMHSGTPVPAVDSQGNFWGGLASVLQVGTGLVNAVTVLQSNTSLSWAKFGLNDTAHFRPVHSVDITNNGPVVVTYNFGYVPSVGFEMLIPLDPDYPQDTPRVKNYQELVPSTMIPSITFPAGPFVVQPGETKTATFTFDYPKGLSNIPAYSGKVMIGGDNGDTLSVPFFGLASHLRADLGSLFPGADLPKIWIGPQYPYATIEEKPYFNFNLSIEVGDYPQLISSYTWGVHEVRWDIYEAGWTESRWTYPPVIGQDGYVGSATFYADSGNGNHWHFDPATDDENDIVPFPDYRQFRSSITQLPRQNYWWLGQMANGSRIAVGNYTMRYAALWPFGDQTVSSDWDKRTWSFAVTPL